MNGGFQVGDGKIGPAFGEKDKFGEGAFPEKEVGKALLAAGADEQIDVGRSATKDLRENGAEGFLREFGHFVEAAGGVVNGVARRIIHGQAQPQARPVCGGGFGVSDGLAQRGGQAVAPANDAETYTLVDAVRGLGQQIFMKDAKDRGDFGGGPLPIGRGQGEQREGVNAKARCSLNDGASGLCAGAVTGGARQAAGRVATPVFTAKDLWLRRIPLVWCIFLPRTHHKD